MIQGCYQILPTETRFGFAKANVEVQKHLDESIHIFYKEEELPYKLIVPQEEKRYVPSQKEALPVGGVTFLFCRKGDIIILH